MNSIYKTYENYRAEANKHHMTWKMKMKRDIFAYLGGERERERERESSEALQEGIAICKVDECSRKQSRTAGFWKTKSRSVRIKVQSLTGDYRSVKPVSDCNSLARGREVIARVRNVDQQKRSEKFKAK